MSQGMIARRYAKALVNLAEKENDLDNAGKNLSALTEVYKENTELREVLSDIKVSSRAKLEILKGVLNEIKAPALVDTFSRYLLTRIGSTVIDGSIQTHLNQIRQSIIRG